MIRVTRLTDYGIMLLTYMAQDPALPLRAAPDLAAEAHLPLPTVSKILKVLARKSVLVAHRGISGGFRLARRPEAISIAEIITALEGPIALTECSANAPGKCQLEHLCPVRSNWQRINQAVRAALEHLTLADMTRPLTHNFMTLRSSRKSAEARRKPGRGEPHDNNKYHRTLDNPGIQVRVCDKHRSGRRPTGTE